MIAAATGPGCVGSVAGRRFGFLLDGEHVREPYVSRRVSQSRSRLAIASPAAVGAKRARQLPAHIRAARWKPARSSGAVLGLAAPEDASPGRAHLDDVDRWVWQRLDGLFDRFYAGLEASEVRARGPPKRERVDRARRFWGRPIRTRGLASG